MNGKEGYVYGISWDRVHITIRDELGVDYVALQPKNLKVLAQPQKSTTKAAGPDWDQYQRDIQESKNKAAVTTDEALKAVALQDEDEEDDEESVTQREEEEDDEFETEEERQAAQEKVLKGLEELGLSPDLLCDSADDALSAITISAQSYVLDLYAQKENREQAHAQEVMEEAYGLYAIAPKKNEGTKENELLFMEIFYKLKAEKATIFEEQDAIADKCLEYELDELLEKQAAEAKGDEEEEDDFVYDEEEMYLEIGQYEPVVRIPEPKAKPKATKKEKLSRSERSEEPPKLSKPDQIPTEEVDTIVRIPEPEPKPKATKKKLSQSGLFEEPPELSKPDQILTEEVDTIVRIPGPKSKPKATKKEKLSQSERAEESPELSKPDQIPTEEMDTGCDCACSIM
jgi:hypothetical protein